MTELLDRRKERLTVHPVEGEYNSLQYWTKAAHPLKVIRNFILIYLCRYLPSENLKNVLFRWTGMKVGKITIGANSIIGYNSVILGHEFLLREWRTGPVIIGQDVVIGANVTILPGVVIGDGATISAMSLVNKDVPPGVVVGGVPIKILSPDVSEEQL